MKPIDAFHALISRFTFSEAIRRWKDRGPGKVVESMSNECRQALSELKSDDISSELRAEEYVDLGDATYQNKLQMLELEKKIGIEPPPRKKYEQMTKEEYFALIKQWSKDHRLLSFHRREHPAYVKLLTEGKTIVPWLFELLQDSIGKESGNKMDLDKNPWLAIMLLLDLTEVGKTMPKEYRGNFRKMRGHFLEWSKTHVA